MVYIYVVILKTFNQKRLKRALRLRQVHVVRPRYGVMSPDKNCLCFSFLPRRRLERVRLFESELVLHFFARFLRTFGGCFCLVLASDAIRLDKNVPPVLASEHAILLY